MAYELTTALRYMRFHRGRTLLLLAGVTVGTAALVVALSLMTGFQEDFRDRILSGTSHLTLANTQEGSVFGNADRVTERIAAIPGVAEASAVLATPAMIAGEDLTSPAYAEIQGVDPARHARIADRGSGFADGLARLGEGEAGRRGGILLGEQLSFRLGVFPGDTVRVIVPKVSLSPFGPVPRTHVLEVVGTFRSDFLQEDAQRAFVSLPTGRRMLREPGKASYIEIRLDDLRRLEPMKRVLRDEFGEGWYVIDWRELNSDLLRALNLEKLMLFLAIGLILVVAAMNILSTLVLMVTNKIKEIGILSAMGSTPRSIALIFMLQGIVLAVLGSTLGLTLGALASWLIDRHQLIPLDPAVYYLSYVPFSTRLFDSLAVAAVAFLICLLATVYPAAKAARLDPVEALRHE